MKDNYNNLIQKLDKFIRKYYINQLIKGTLFFGAFIIALFLIINALEYYLYLPATFRKLLFYGFILSGILVFTRFIAVPLIHYFRLGKVISHEKAASIIGNHFQEVKDKLLNILQLRQQKYSSSEQDLIEASIDQKIIELNPVPFVNAINLKENKRYLKYFIPPTLVLLFVLIAAPNVIKEGSQRLIRNNLEFEREMPFSFIIENEKLSVVQHQDFTLELKVEGKVLPNEVFLRSSGHSYKLKALQTGQYSHTFNNLQDDVEFALSASGFTSKGYTVEVLPKPKIVAFTASLDYPSYLGKKAEVLNNIGDLNVPVGTRVNWRFNAANTGRIDLQFADTTQETQRTKENEFSYSKPLYKNEVYTIRVSNEFLNNADSISYTINVTPDQYPSIYVDEHQDSTNRKFLYYLGEVSDDHGLRKLTFNFEVDSGGVATGMSKIDLPLNKDQKIQQFSHYWNLYDLKLSPGDKINYYFEVWDNDGVSGSKSTKSALMTFEMPTLNELEDKTEKQNDEIKSELKEAISSSKELKDEIEKLKDKLIEKKNIGWEDKKSLENLVEKQKQLEKNVENLTNKFNENLEEQKEYKKVDEDILKKQEQLQELFEEVLSDEMKELFEKMEEMMDEMMKEDVMEQLEDFEFTDENLEKELDRMLELFKQLEFEQKLTETIDKLDELAKEQEKLSEESNEKNADSESLQEEQEKLNEEFEKIAEDLEDLDKMGEELQNDPDMSKTDEMKEDISESMKQASDQLQKQKNKNASEQQKSASDKMKEMSDELASMQMQMQMDQMSQNLEALRQLLENLVYLSFEQEELIAEIRKTNINNPRYVELIQRQFKLKDDSEMVEDSLYALAKQVFEIKSFVTKEIAEINKNLDNAIEQLEDRKVNQGNTSQQYVMTGYNNLALMLSEVMDQMQQQMAQQMSGEQMCQNPSQKKGGKMPSLQQMQKQLNDQMSEMKDAIKKGEKPNGKQMSKSLAKMAAQQAAIRQKLKEINNQENKDGKNSLGDLEEMMDMMEKSETDLVNKQLTNELMKRQKDIETRLLEAANAERQREKDNKRESTTGKQLANEVPPGLEEYLKQREAEIDLYRTVPPALKPYYKTLVEKYFKNISFSN